MVSAFQADEVGSIPTWRSIFSAVEEWHLDGLISRSRGFESRLRYHTLPPSRPGDDIALLTRTEPGSSPGEAANYEAAMSETQVATRPAHLWKPGQSGNPSGRPRGTKNHITKLKQELEAAVRENLNPSAIKEVLERMVELALAGNVGAAKLILDKVLSNAKDTEDAPESGGKFVFEVKNLTIKGSDEAERPIIDITPTETHTDEQPEQPAPQRSERGREHHGQGPGQEHPAPAAELPGEVGAE